MWTVLIAVFGCALLQANAGQLYAAAPQSRGQYYSRQAGNYNYGYNTGEGSAKVEVKREDGSVVGSYRYFDPNGKQIVRSYIADSNGFRLLGNDLPIAPETPAAAVIGAPALTASVEGAHQSVVESAQDPSKSYNTVDIERISSPYQTRTVATEEEDNSENHFYYPYQYNFAFPAGFAYPSLVAAPPQEAIVGVRAAPETVDTLYVSAAENHVPQVVSVEGVNYRPLYRRPSFVVGRRF